ncbi:hypothetical protein EIP86_002456 [Pleurotus ostreatoroseus]|nr:hypothetical protein EIP86_002456 [Pleurotus ostreatoroseus]
MFLRPACATPQLPPAKRPHFGAPGPSRGGCGGNRSYRALGRASPVIVEPAGPSAAGPTPGSVDVLIGPCVWRAEEVHDLFMNITRPVRLENPALLDNAILRVRLNAHPDYARVILRTRALAATLVSEFNAREPSMHPGTCARFDTV